MPEQVSNVAMFIQNILIKDHGLRIDQVGREKKIATDLGVDGDDAWEILDKLSYKYSVDIDDVFELHFWPEAGLFKSSKVVPISIEELALVVVSRMQCCD